MFGHDDQDDNKTGDGVTVSPAADAPTDTTVTVDATTDELTTGAPAVDTSTDAAVTTQITDAPTAGPVETTVSSDDSAEETPLIASSGTPDPVPSDDSTVTEPEASDADNTENSGTTPVFSDSEVDEPSDNTTTSVTATDDTELLSLKKDAIDELAPLLDQLDQSPEEKFKTTMMMIQATDSSNLVKVAHAAAKEIPDEKVRAQALLDIVNEINYFTHPSTDKN